jgi:DNA-binding response OmpR family regulator
MIRTGKTTLAGVEMNVRPKILLVDDEAAITTTLNTFLMLSGFEVATARDGQQALDLIGQWSPDLVVMDVLMPRLDGRETLRRLRQRGDWIPVILLTQINGTAERIMALEEGADDYLNKPFDPQELAVRIRAVLRRTRPGKRSLQAARQIACNNLVLDRTARRARINAQEIPLTPKAVAILEYLMTHPDELITRDRLLDAVWGWENVVGTRVVDTRIAELRKALADNPAHPDYIETVPGQGYRFVGTVVETS